MARYIEADELREELFESSQFDTYNDYSMVIDAIDLAPTIEAEPVKHGKWDLVEGDCSILARCSVCGRNVVGGISWDLKGNEYRYKYCPNCGAKMDEVK